MSFVQRALRPRHHAAPVLALFAVLAMLLGRPPHPALAFTATGTFAPNGSGTGVGFSTTMFGFGTSTVQITLQGAKPAATYQVFACLALTTGGFSCVGHNNPPAFQQILVSPKAIAPVSVTLAQQGTLTTDANGNGSAVVSLQSLLLSDTPASIYNVVQLVNMADATDSYTAVDMQAPTLPVAGVNSFVLPGVALAIGVPVYVLVQFPGYAYPVSVTIQLGAPFVPFFAVPFGVFSFPFPFAITVGACPNGTAPIARSSAFGNIVFTC